MQSGQPHWNSNSVLNSFQLVSNVAILSVVNPSGMMAIGDSFSSGLAFQREDVVGMLRYSHLVLPQNYDIIPAHSQLHRDEPTLRRQLERPMDAGRRHLQRPSIFMLGVTIRFGNSQTRTEIL